MFLPELFPGMEGGNLGKQTIDDGLVVPPDFINRSTAVGNRFLENTR